MYRAVCRSGEGNETALPVKIWRLPKRLRNQRAQKKGTDHMVGPLEAYHFS